MGRLLSPHARPLTLKSVVRYSPNWVKNQNRMASTSNQETYRTDVDGRLVFDILRQVICHPDHHPDAAGYIHIAVILLKPAFMLGVQQLAQPTCTTTAKAAHSTYSGALS